MRIVSKPISAACTAAIVDSERISTPASALAPRRQRTTAAMPPATDIAVAATSHWTYDATLSGTPAGYPKRRSSGSHAAPSTISTMTPMALSGTTSRASACAAVRVASHAATSASGGNAGRM